ncbi:MAG: 2-C-methyl-D-erythritol 2,4-cyclodiphosphate synthase [Calditrichaeota bacterium]|nr:MAG: 2-C-methyl-D-erythritol 2,4-cyclodiphosphate synthase [Calditrichota bacterium]
MRVGHGFDVHRFVDNRLLILGGVRIDFEKGLLGHSDADVLCHAISDALLGAAAMGDIGKHFPDTDPAYKNASSILLLKTVAQKLAVHQWQVVNIDSTLIMQRPKVSPFVDQMRENIASACAIQKEQVSVKATTSEGLGFTGREEGAAAHAVVLIEKRLGE